MKVTAETITALMLSSTTVVDAIGYEPGYRNAFCPKCRAVSPDRCRGRTRKPHVARMKVFDLILFLHRERAAEVWNARHGATP